MDEDEVTRLLKRVAAAREEEDVVCRTPLPLSSSSSSSSSEGVRTSCELTGVGREAEEAEEAGCKKDFSSAGRNVLIFAPFFDRYS